MCIPDNPLPFASAFKGNRAYKDRRLPVSHCCALLRDTELEGLECEQQKRKNGTEFEVNFI
jgi:hypothetical protein